MNQSEINKLKETEEAVAEMMVIYARSGRTVLNTKETDAIESCMQLAGCNTSNGRMERRRIEANLILRNCISRVDRIALKKIENVLMGIATH